MNLTHEQALFLRIAKKIVEAYSDNREIELRHEDFTSLNWSAFFALLKKHKLFLLSYKYIESFIPNFLLDDIKRYYNEQIEFIDFHIQELKSLNNFAQKHSETLLVVKGLCLSVLIYDDIYTREFNDLDVFVRNKYDSGSIAQFKNLLMKECSYLHRVGGRDIDFFVDELGIFHEYVLRKKVKEGKYIAVELKAASSAIDNGIISEFLNPSNTQSIKISGIDVITNNISHTLLHLFSNIYGDTEKRLGVERKNLIRDLVDVSIFIAKYRSDIDWINIKELSRRYKFTYKVYNVLYRLKYMGFITDILQDDILNMFKPTEYVQEYIDNIGGKVAWKQHDFVDRIFDVKGRIDEYCELQYLKNSSECNRNYKNRIVLDNGKYYCWDNVSMKMFPQYKVLYAFGMSSNAKNILVATKLPKEVLSNFPYTICYLFYNGGRPYFVYVETKYNNSCYYISTPDDRRAKKGIEDLEKRKCTVVDCDQEVIIEASISLEQLGAPLKKGLICYNVMVQKYLFENVKTITDVKFCEPNDPEEWFEHMGVIQYEE